MQRRESYLTSLDELAPAAVLRKLLPILKKQEDERNSADVLKIVKLTQNVLFFRQYIEEGHPEVHKMCCQMISYEHFSAGEYVFHIDTIGRKFYIILDGRVEVLVRPVP